jgi:hypothetical protein
MHCCSGCWSRQSKFAKRQVAHSVSNNQWLYVESAAALLLTHPEQCLEGFVHEAGVPDVVGALHKQAKTTCFASCSRNFSVF